jgi:hypothetical protein
MNLNAEELRDQVKLILTMSYGHPLMEDMVRINVSWDNRLLISEESKIVNASMEKN